MSLMLISDQPGGLRFRFFQISSIYYQFASRFMRARLVYRTSFWLDLASQFLEILLLVYLWRALLSSGPVANTTLNDMIVYIVLGQMIHHFTGSKTAEYIEDRLTSGDIAVDLARPVTFRTMMFLEDLGSSVSSLVLGSLPLLVVAIIWLDFGAPPSLLHLCAFLLLLAGGLLVAFYISYIVGLIGFHFVRTSNLVWLVGTIQIFLSGRMIPLWFYPDWLRVIAEAAPFKLVYYTPISVYMGRTSVSEFGSAFLVLLSWLAVLVATESLLWKRTMSRLVLQGG